MRKITNHIVNGDSVNHQLDIIVQDEPGAGGANHKYLVLLPDDVSTEAKAYPIVFQNGAIKEVGVNGLTHEALLAIVIDRLLAFQNGPFPSEYNHKALQSCQVALSALQMRTKERIARGVEGTIQK